MSRHHGIRLLQSVKDWKLDASDEDERYLYEPPEMASLLAGERVLVIGKKGAGKTAIQRRVSTYCVNNKIPFRSFSAVDLDFHALADISKNISQITGFWREIIYSVAIELMGAMKPDGPATLIGAASRALGDLARFIRETDFEVHYGALSLKKSKSMDWQQRSNESLEFINNGARSSNLQRPIYVIFDQLDDGFRADTSPQELKAFVSIVTGLMRAALSIRLDNAARASSNGANAFKVIPVVMVRSDVHELVSDPQKTNWADKSVKLDWRPDDIKKLLSFRISVDSGLPPDDFKHNWESVFTIKSVDDPYDAGTKEAFDYIDFRTCWRPRDFIKYIREAAKNAVDTRNATINVGRLVTTEVEYSAYVRDQLLDEGLPHIPALPQHFQSLAVLVRAHLKKRHFDKTEFNTALGGDANEIDRLLDQLYDLNIIGNFESDASGHKHNRYKFKYKEKFHAGFNRNKPIAIHPGVHRFLRA